MLARTTLVRLVPLVAAGMVSTHAPSNGPNVPSKNPIAHHWHSSSGADRRAGHAGGSGPQLYYGGPIISHVRVVNVNWGNTIDSSVATGSDGFYKAIIASDYMDALGEYDSVGVVAQGGATGSNQRIYRGTSVTTVTIMPKVTSGTVMNADIEAELDAQITSGTLPAPAFEANGFADTLYMITFPTSVTLNDGTGSACGSFDAYHDKVTLSGKTVPFGAIAPCWSTFDDWQGLASHEFAEAVTDAVPSADTPVIGAQAWNDSQGYEVCDVCDQSPPGSVGSYTNVAAYWSNRMSQCITGDPNLPLCGTTRPCRPCTAQDCTAPQTCDTDPASATLGQCITATPPGTGSSSGSSSSGSSSSETGSSGTSSSTGGSGSSGGPASSGGSSGGAGSSGGSASNGGSGSGVSFSGSDAGDDGGANGLSPTTSSGCACGTASARAKRDAAGSMLLGVALSAWRRRRRGKPVPR